MPWGINPNLNPNPVLQFFNNIANGFRGPFMPQAGGRRGAGLVADIFTRAAVRAAQGIARAFSPFVDWLYWHNQERLGVWSNVTVNTSHQGAQDMVNNSLNAYARRHGITIDRNNLRELGRLTAHALQEADNYGDKKIDIREYVEGFIMDIQRRRANGESEENINKLKEGFFQGLTEVINKNPHLAQSLRNAIVGADTYGDCNQLGPNGHQIFQDFNLEFANYELANGGGNFPNGVWGGYDGNGSTIFEIRDGRVVRNRIREARPEERIYFSSGNQSQQTSNQTTPTGQLPNVVAVMPPPPAPQIPLITLNPIVNGRTQIPGLPAGITPTGILHPDGNLVLFPVGQEGSLLGNIRMFPNAYEYVGGQESPAGTFTLMNGTNPVLRFNIQMQ